MLENFNYETDIKPYLNDLGPFANIASLLGIGLISIFSYIFRPRILLKYPSIRKWVSDISKRNYDWKKLKIVIIDDEESSVPLDYFKNIGYNVTYMERVSLSKIDNILNYDIVFLDVKGVLEEDMEDGGMILLKKIRENNPIIPVISISGYTVDFSKMKFFKLATRVMEKPLSTHDVDSLMDDLIRNELNPENIAMKIDNALEEVSWIFRKYYLYKYIKFFTDGKSLISNPTTTNIRNDLLRIRRYVEKYQD